MVSWGLIDLNSRYILTTLKFMSLMWISPLNSWHVYQWASLLRYLIIISNLKCPKQIYPPPTSAFPTRPNLVNLLLIYVCKPNKQYQSPISNCWMKNMRVILESSLTLIYKRSLSFVSSASFYPLTFPIILHPNITALVQSIIMCCTELCIVLLSIPASNL